MSSLAQEYMADAMVADWVLESGAPELLLSIIHGSKDLNGLEKQKNPSLIALRRLASRVVSRGGLKREIIRSRYNSKEKDKLWSLYDYLMKLQSRALLHNLKPVESPTVEPHCDEVSSQFGMGSAWCYGRRYDWDKRFTQGMNGPGFEEVEHNNDNDLVPAFFLRGRDNDNVRHHDDAVA